MSKLTAQDLAHFTGTTRYYRISKQHLLTDGTHYLAEQAGCYWIMDAVSSHVTEIGTVDWFVVIRIEVVGCRAVMRYEDGNGRDWHAKRSPTQTSRSQTSRSTLCGTLSIGSSCCLVSIE